GGRSGSAAATTAGGRSGSAATTTAGGRPGSAAPTTAGGRSGSAAPTTAVRAVRVGLHRVAGLAHATGERILAARPFASLADLVARARPTPPELAALTLAGALDALPVARTRASMRLEARVHEAVSTAVPARARRAANPRAAGLLDANGLPLAPAAS